MVMAIPMVGRAPALDELRRAWLRVRDGGESITAVLTGAAGTGKSTLVAHLLRAAGPAVVLAGSARVHSPAPYDWLAAVLAGRDPSGLDVPADALAWLKQDPDVPRERYTPDALLRIAVTTVRQLVGGAPAILVVEDLHALDPASLNLVAALDLPALLLVTCLQSDQGRRRGGWTGSQPPEDQLTARTLARLAGRPGALRRHLAALTPAEVGEILQHVYGVSAVTADLAAAVCRRTEGNPYRLAELIAVEGADGPAALAGHSAGLTDLTAREREVLGLLAEGMSNKQIARVLGISVRTVTVHVSNLLRKTGAASRTEAALWALQGGREAPVRTPPG